MQIRPGRPEDHDEVLALDMRSFEAGTSPGPPLNEQDQFFERVAAQDHLLAIVDGHIVGYARMGHPTPLPASQHVVEIRGLAVDPDHRGQGIAGQLLEAVVEEARSRSAHKVSLRVLGTNPGARRLYERMGFVQEGHLRDEFLIDGEYVDDFMLAKLLDPPVEGA